MKIKPVHILFVVFVVVFLAVIFYLVVNRAKNTTIIDKTMIKAVALTIQPEPSAPYDRVEQIIQFRVDITNVGNVSIPGIVTFEGATVNCPSINDIGNHDSFFDANELLPCNTSHTITQADLDAGSVTIVAAANVNGTISPTATVSVPMIQNRLLTLSKTADPQTYDHVGQIITYTYVITNSGNITLSPAQFTGNDTAFEMPIACGEQNISLAPKESLTCTATYTITQADMDAGSVTTSAVSSASGAVISPAVSVTITRSDQGVSALPASPADLTTPSNLTPGITIQHTVVVGEWLWQIARCYGADQKQVIKVNSQLADPDEISPGMTVSVPNIGSVGIIYGPPCIRTYTVQTGDTWSSIALKYDADLIVLQRVNPDGLAAGMVLKVPVHSAGAP